MFIECPHCNAIFALPEGMDYTDDEKRMRCGECSTVFCISKQLTTSIHTTKNQSSHFNFDHMFEGELYEDTEEPLDTPIHSSTSVFDNLDDTIELSSGSIATIDSNEQQHGSPEETADTLIAIEDDDNDLPASLDSSTITDEDIFEDYIKKNQLNLPDQSEGITSKDSGAILNDSEDLLPEINMDVDQQTDDGGDDDQVHNNSRHTNFPEITTPSDTPSDTENKSISENDEKGSGSNKWVELPTLDNLQLIKEEDLQHLSHSGMSSNDSVQRDIVNSGSIDENPVFATNEEEKQSQSSLSLEIQEDLLGENFIDIPISDSYMDETISGDNADFTPADTLLSINRDDSLTADNKFAKPAPTAGRNKTVLYGSICLLLLILLGTQYVYNNRLNMASSPTTKPLVSVICKIAGCEIKVKRSSDLIEIVDKSIFNLPNSDNILVINATIKNKADHPQPYPVVEILFSDINENTLAMRRFGAAEYLQNIPLHKSLMPTDEAVYLQLQVADPGRSATSFRFNFL